MQRYKEFTYKKCGGFDCDLRKEILSVKRLKSEIEIVDQGTKGSLKTNRATNRRAENPERKQFKKNRRI